VAQESATDPNRSQDSPVLFQNKINEFIKARIWLISPKTGAITLLCPQKKPVVF
jgi:hypothetical protein